MSVVVYHELYDACVAVECLTGKPPTEIQVVDEPGEPPARDVAIIERSVWRELVRIALADLGTPVASEAELDRMAAHSGWRFLGRVPVRP